MKNKLVTVLWSTLLLATACSTIHKSDSANFQGTWEGLAPGDNSGLKILLVLSGKNFDCHDANNSVWYKGTFILREDTTPKQFIATVTSSSLPQYAGKTSMAIYKLVDGKLTITGNEPGQPEVPKAFDAAGAACLELKKQ